MCFFKVRMIRKTGNRWKCFKVALHGHMIMSDNKVRTHSQSTLEEIQGKGNVLDLIDHLHMYFCRLYVNKWL